MFQQDDSVEDSFDAFVLAKKGTTPFKLQREPEAMPAEVEERREEKMSPPPSALPKQKEEAQVRVPVKKVHYAPEPDHHGPPLQAVGGRVALRATAPAGKSSLRQSLGLRRSMPAHDAHVDKPARSLPPGAGGSMLVMSGMENLLEKVALQMSDQQIQYVVGGEQCVVIGGTGGIGKAISTLLTDYGADVTVVARRKNDEVHRSIQCDLSTVAAQIDLANRLDVESMHMLIFCITTGGGRKRKDNGEGIEEELAVSYLARRVILDRLLERGLNPKCRVFVLNDAGEECAKKDLSNFNAERGYNAKTQAHNCVVGNDALVLGMRKRHPHLKIWGVNPGVIAGTDLRNSRYKSKTWGKIAEGVVAAHTLTPDEYSHVLIHIISNPNLSRHTFAYGWRRHHIEPTIFLQNPKNVDKVWEITDDLIEKAKQ